MVLALAESVSAIGLGLKPSVVAYTFARHECRGNTKTVATIWNSPADLLIQNKVHTITNANDYVALPKALQERFLFLQVLPVYQAS